MIVKKFDKTISLCAKSQNKQYGATVAFCGTPAEDGVKSVTVWKEGSGRGEVVICDGRSPSQPRNDVMDAAFREANGGLPFNGEKAGRTLLAAFGHPSNQWPDGFRELVSEVLNDEPVAA